ncbi:hypothetical protein HGA91_02265 [candidate division WWE3 bacterium]|nr:hypothetical protein [candidate division WWE3 bacterium]
MLTWSPILHFYQPPTQDIGITQQVLRSNYLPILKAIQQHPDVHLTINITGSLTLQLQELDANDFFDLMKELTGREQIEILSTPLYHPLLPLIPPSVGLRQIEYNAQITRQFYNTETISGIYPPELAITTSVLDCLIDKFDFCIVSESSINPDYNLIEFPKHPILNFNGLTLIQSTQGVTEVLRSHRERINADKFVEFLSQGKSNDLPIISVNDVELFGHHYQGRLDFFIELMNRKDLQIRKVTEAITQIQQIPTIERKDIYPGTWETTYEQHKRHDYFPTWFAQDNRLQELYIRLMRLVEQGFHEIPRPDNDINLIYSSAERHFDRGISSCHLFWLSNYPWWHPDLAEAGAQELIRSMRSLPGTIELKRETEVLFSEFIKELWLYHWSGKIEEGYEKFDKDRSDFYAKLPHLT